jgi:hypothetical protein
LTILPKCCRRIQSGILEIPAVLIFAIACIAMQTICVASALQLSEHGLQTKRVITVGPGREYARPSLAALAASDGDTIEILAATFRGDVAVWSQNNLTIRGVFGTCRMEADGNAAEGKAIWVIKGDNVVVENVEFSGARVSDGNGAGIRFEGKNLVLKNCYFHDNENGILTGENPASQIIIQNCEFAHNGSGDGQTHNMYIGAVKSFTLKESYSHHARVGHNVKTRARTNFILYNRIMDEKDGTSSYAIDISNGGITYMVGNLIQQGAETDNWHIISYGAEGLAYEKNELYMINNSVLNQKGSGVFVRVNDEASPAFLVNNLFYGTGELSTGPVRSQTNLHVKDRKLLGIYRYDTCFVDLDSYDLRLESGSPAIDAGSDPGMANGLVLSPTLHYVHRDKGQKRIPFKQIDIGAYEFVPAE